MTNDSLKKTIGFIMDNRKELNEILDYLNKEELKNGILAIPEQLINQGLRARVLAKSDWIKTYNFIFLDGSVLIDGNIAIPKIGVVNFKYLVTITDFAFGENGHRITFTYKEDVRGENAVAQMALTAFKLGGTLLQRAAAFAKPKEAVYATDSMASIELDRMGMLKKVPSNLNLEYLSCANGSLKFKYWLS